MGHPPHHHQQHYQQHSYEYGQYPQHRPSLHPQHAPQQWPSLQPHAESHHQSPQASPHQSPSRLHTNSEAWSPTNAPKWPAEAAAEEQAQPHDLKATAEPWGMDTGNDSDTESDHSRSSDMSTDNPWSHNARKNSWSSQDSTSSVSSIEIVPSQHNENDGFNYGKMPSGCVAVTSSGQWVEFWQGVHVDANNATVPGKKQPAQNWSQPSSSPR